MRATSRKNLYVSLKVSIAVSHATLLPNIMIANDNIYKFSSFFLKVEVNFEEQNKNKIGLKCTPKLRTRRLGSRFNGSHFFKRVVRTV